MHFCCFFKKEEFFKIIIAQVFTSIGRKIFYDVADAENYIFQGMFTEKL